jgi:hypothetical protein
MTKLHLKYMDWYCRLLFRCFCQAFVEDNRKAAIAFHRRYMRADKKRRALMNKLGMTA